MYSSTSKYTTIENNVLRQWATKRLNRLMLKWSLRIASDFPGQDQVTKDIDDERKLIMKRCIFIMILLSWQTIAMCALSTKITPSTARLGETINLTLTLDGASNGVPDVTPLKKDFTIVGTENSMSYTAANGVAKSESQWVIVLVAKKSGVLPIPSIQVGQQYSSPGQVNITSSIKMAASNDHAVAPADDAIMLDAKLGKSNPYINEQVIYTVKLYSRTPLMNAEYHPPHVEDALLIPLGDGRRYQTTMNGREYAVDEQQYAIFSQKSGALPITPPEFNAVVYDTIPRHIHVDGPATKLIVKPIPEKNTTMPWFPAKHVSLSEQLNPAITTVVQGNTIERTITLQANAMPAELLPTLAFPENKQFSIYPEKPETRNALRQQELIGTSTVKVTYLLNQAGRITLPAIQLGWFNTVTGKQETAVLPEHELTVTGKPNALPAAPVAQTHQTVLAPLRAGVAPDIRPHQLAWRIAAALTLVGVITLAFGWWLLRHRKSAIKPSTRKALLQLRKACATNDPVSARATLLNWGRIRWPDAALLNIDSLSSLIEHSELKKQITLLSQALYSQNNASTWCGDTLWRAVKRYRAMESTQKPKKKALPPINPGLT